jgi:phosphate transport system substrate-binding protein
MEAQTLIVLADWRAPCAERILVASVKKRGEPVKLTTRLAALLLFAIAPWPVLAQSADKILIDGSTGLTPLVAALAHAYQQQKPGISIEIGKGLGTRARIEALNAGKIDIAMASHGLKVDEIRTQGMVVHEFAKVAVVFGVHSSVSANSLAANQICDLYAGKVTNWKVVGAADLPVVAMTRPDTEVDTEVVREKVGCLTNLKMPATVRVAPKAGEMAAALSTTPGAIGMTTMTVVEQSGSTVRAIALNGIEPSPVNVQNKTYGLTRDSFLVTKAAPSPEVARFIEFVRSGAGEKVIAANGAIPVK